MDFDANQGGKIPQRRERTNSNDKEVEHKK